MAMFAEVEMTEEERNVLLRPVVGQGGMQNLLRAVQRGVFHNRLRLSWTTARKLVAYSGWNAGNGGWQGRLLRVRDELAKQIAAEDARTKIPRAGS